MNNGIKFSYYILNFGIFKDIRDFFWKQPLTYYPIFISDFWYYYVGSICSELSKKDNIKQMKNRRISKIRYFLKGYK